jgi:hypothetical protein
MIVWRIRAWTVLYSMIIRWIVGIISSVVRTRGRGCGMDMFDIIEQLCGKVSSWTDMQESLSPG